MRKKDHQPQSHNLTSNKQFIIASAFKHYERNKIDSTVLGNFNSLIYSITLKLVRYNNEPQFAELFKITNELIVGFIANLSEETYRHTCTHEDILQFMLTIANYFEKSVTIFGFGQLILQSNLINIFWPLFEKHLQGPKNSDQVKIDLLNTLIQNIEQPKKNTSSFGSVIKQSFFVANATQKRQSIQIKERFVSFLRQSSRITNLREILLKYLTIVLSQNNEQLFRKALKIYEHLGSTIQERRANLQDLLLKTLQYSNCLPFLIEINECVTVSKLVKSANLPKVIERVLQKIFAKTTTAPICVKILEELSSANNHEFKEFNVEKIVPNNENLVVRFLQWISLKYSKKEQSQNTISTQVLQLRQKMLEQAQFKEEKIMQFVRKMHQFSSNDVVDPERMNQLKNLCISFSNFIKNLFRHQAFRKKISLKNVDQINIIKFCDKLQNPYVVDFILDIFPHLIEELTFNPKDRSSIKYSIILRKIEIESEKTLNSLKHLKDSFKEVYYQMLQAESLNYHFVACFIFLKYEKDKDSLRYIIIDAIIKDLKEQGNNKNVRNILLSISLLLKSFDKTFISLPIKFKVKQVIKNSQLLSSKIDVNHLILVQPKQYTNVNHCKLKAQSKIEEMKQALNNEMFKYDAKEHLNIFYNVIIAVNDLVGAPIDQSENVILNQIGSLRRLSMTSEIYVYMHLTNSAIDKISANYEFSHPLKIDIFMLLLKIKKLADSTSIKQGDDTDQLFQRLKYFMILMNSQLNHDLLTHLQNFRSNQKSYINQPYEKLIQQKQIIKFYAQVTKDIYLTHVILNVTAKNLLSKLMEVKRVDFIDLPEQLKNILLLYSKAQELKLYGYSSEQEQLLTTYLMTLLLNQKIKQEIPLENLLKKISGNTTSILKLFLPRHHKDSFKNLMITYPVNFFKICVNAVKRALTNSQKEDFALFDFIKTVIQEDNNNCGCLEEFIRNFLQKQLDTNVCELIFNRTKNGFEAQSKSLYFKHSQILYKLVGKNLQKSKDNLLALVQNIVQLDCYDSSDKSAFLLKQVSYIFTYLEEKSSQICQTIFNYILTLTDIFKGDQKLEISTFICNFFGLQINLNQSVNFQNFQKQPTAVCSNVPNYKCLKCDDKKIVCYGCAFTCHENHPVCYLNIPIQLKFTRCLCCEIGSNNCKLAKDNPNTKVNIYGKPPSFMGITGLKPIVGPGSNPPQEFFQRMKIVGGNFMPSSRHPRENLYEPPLPSDKMQFQAFLREQELEQQIRGNHAWERQRQRREERQENFPRMGGRLQKLFERDEFPGGYRMFIQSNDVKRTSKTNANAAEKDKEKIEHGAQAEDEFVDEYYFTQDQRKVKKEEEMPAQHEDGNTILKKSVLLPKFIDLMVNFCDKKSDKDKSLANVQMFKLSFTNPSISKVQPTNIIKLHNVGNFTFDVRKENAIHNMSCFLVKKNVAQNNKFLLLASSTQIFVFSKDKILQCLSQMKSIPGYNSIARHSISFEIHSIDFSPSQKHVFCAAGLHNLAILNINNQGQIVRTNNRYNVSNCYINQIKLAKMGIFIGVDKEIRVLNYTCRHYLTIKAQQSNVIIREWTIFQKAAGCQVLFVCPNGNIFTVDIMPSDQGRKEFVARINDHRPNKTGVGASIFGKQLPEIGKYLFASFKDGTHNILGHLEGDQLEDMIGLSLKGLKFDKNLFDSYFIVGHSDLIKMPQVDELYLICTVKKYFPPELSFHQGFLIAIKFKKDGNSEIIVINDQATCEYFQVVKLGKRNFYIYSIHSDGSVQITAFNKITKQIIEEQLNAIKQSEDVSNQNDNSENKQNVQDINALRKSIEKQIKIENIIHKGEKPLFTPFREGAELLKSGVDFNIQKLNENEYQLKIISFSKVITGFSLPFFGEVELPTRKIKNIFEVGFTQLQILYFFAQGSFKFKYMRNQDQKYTREAFFNANNHPRMLERLERMQRLSEYHEGEKMFNSHLMNTILGFKEDTNSQIQFLGKNFDVFKGKIPKFQDMFKVETDNQTNSIEKTALIIKMFLTKALQLGNACSEEEILQLVKGVKSIIALSSKRLFNILKDIIVLAIKVYQHLTGKNLTINDQNYALRAATENRVAYYFKMLKLDISQGDLNQFLSLLCEIIKEDSALMTFYVAKYSGIFVHLHRRLKKPDTQQRANFLIILYTFAYPILKFCEIPCSWILSSICSIVYSYLGSKSVRETLYQAIQNTNYISFENSIKNVTTLEEMVEQVDLANNNVPEPKKQEVKDPMVEIYNMYNRGEIDDQTLFKMITDASKLEYERQQQNQMAVQQNNLQIQPQLQQQMQVEQNVLNHNIAFVLDQVDECTDNINQNIEVAYSKIIVLYVVSKAIDKFFPEGFKHLLKRMKKMVNQIDLKCEGDKLNSTLAFACLFNNILVNSKYLKENGGRNTPLYLDLQTQVNNKLNNMRLENITKIKQIPNLLGKVFKGEKTNFNINIAYALTFLLLFPCQPTHVLLSLECYWLLPQKKQFYSKKKDFSNITDGIQSGNIQKIYEIAKNNPKIWQEYNQLSFVQKWIQEKRPNWELALELMAIYYQD